MKHQHWHVAVLLGLVVGALGMVTIGNTRPIGDGVLFRGRVLNPSVDLNSYRNCFADTGNSSAPFVYGGWTTSIASVDMCCVDRGFVDGNGAHAVCEYGCPPPNAPSRSPHFIAPFAVDGAPCLTNCFAMGTTACSIISRCTYLFYFY